MVTEDLRVADTDAELAMHALTIGKPSVKPIRLDVDTGALYLSYRRRFFDSCSQELSLSLLHCC